MNGRLFFCWVSTRRSRPQQPSKCLFLQATGEEQNVSVLERIGNGAVFGLTAFFAGTFLVALLTYIHKFNKPDARARRKVGNLLHHAI